MECTRLKNWNFCWNRRNKFFRLDVDIGYTGKIYTLWFSLSGRKKRGASYWRHGNIAIPDNTKYNTQCQDDPSKQHFVQGNSSELKLENRKESVYGVLHVTTQLTLNDDKCVFLRIHIWIKSRWFRLPLIYIWQLELIRKSRKNKK